MVIITNNYSHDFRAVVEWADPLPSGRQNVFIELGPEHNGVRVLMSTEQLRELYHVIGDALDEHLSTPKAAVIDSIPMFVPDTSA